MEARQVRAANSTLRRKTACAVVKVRRSGYQRYRKGDANWSLGPGRKVAAIVWEPSAWETLLAGFGLSERAEPQALLLHTGVRKWVDANWHRRFVPEGVLMLLGISGEWA
jgi:hypothetical protein